MLSLKRSEEKYFRTVMPKNEIHHVVAEPAYSVEKKDRPPFEISFLCTHPPPQNESNEILNVVIPCC